MMNNNHKNSNCGFSEELVSYLYGETAAAENAAFEAHLKTCAGCAEELEAFSGVHFSINDWKLKEFANLAAPSIEIPYEKTEKSVEISDVSGSWLSAFRRGLFSLSPRGWSLATASFVVLAVAVAIALFALNSRKVNEITENNTKSNPAPVPTIEKTSEASNINQNKQADKKVEPLQESKAPQPDVAVTTAPEPKNTRVVKVSNNPARPSQKVENTNSPKNNEAKRSKNNAVPPKIVVDEDDEDNTLRLAELFDEIDTKE